MGRTGSSAIAIGAWLALAALPCTGAESETPGPKVEMARYQLVLLLGGPKEGPMGEREVQAKQEAHLAFLKRLHDEGKAIASGPVWRGGKLRGVVVLDVASTEDAASLMRADPWVEAGRFVIEVHPWLGPKGVFQPPTSFAHMTRYYLGLLKRPAGAPDYPEAKLAEIQAGHMENIRRMAASGDLVAAGPFLDDGVLRGIFVFRTLEAERVKALVAEDPAVKAGRLEAEILAWSLPEGSVP